ncbi:SDR family NAD(P)-dependent oxidoreductase, partial [Alkalihalophilus lindianensis]
GATADEFAALGAMSDALRAVVGDVSKPADAARAVAVALDAFGGLSGLVNNAGLAEPASAPLDRLDLAAWQRTLDVNLTGALV